MNTIKNTENRSSKTHEDPSELFHPIDAEKNEEESNLLPEEEKRKTIIWFWMVIFFIIGCIAVQHHPKSFLKTSPHTSSSTKSFSISPYLNANVPRGSQLVDLKNDAIRDALDSAEENFIETQTGQEFSYRKTTLFENTQQTIFTQHAHFQLPKKHKKSIQKWLQEQEIQQITYKQFESYFTMNHQIFHLGDMVDAEQQIQFVDIDPMDRKIFFSDRFKNRYPLSY